MNGVEITEILERFNFKKGKSEWLSIDSSVSRVIKEGADCQFGEHNSSDNLHGRGICIYSDGGISIRYWNKGGITPGNCIIIFRNGEFWVGEIYLKDGKKCDRGTRYKEDGTQQKFNY